jgi:HK97 gp10 family phage protein
MKIDIRGDKELIKKLESMVDSRNIEEALGKACALVERSAKEKAPKGTGELRRSIASKVENQEGIVYSPLEYAPYVEYGTGLFAEDGGRTDVPWCYKDDEGNWHTTSGQKPQPYLRPALHENRKKIVEIIKEGLLND